MPSNLEKYKAGLAALVEQGAMLLVALQYEHYPERVEKLYAEKSLDFAALKAKLPRFSSDYQNWYSEARAVVKQLLPDRLENFVGHYEKPKSRKDITWENYVIEDSLQGLRVSRGGQKVVGADAAIPQFEQQLNILGSAEKRFESSLFDIKQVLQADLFDSEAAAARELLKNGFGRAAGAVAGVVLEKHLAQVCENHKVKVTKKDPTVSTLNDLLKDSGVFDVAPWRFIQHLGDLRNLCDHNKKREPTTEEVEELIAGVEKITKTLF
jgi:hypothetical protein